MKKIVPLLLGITLVLTGCSSTKKVGNKEVVASVDGFDILADDVYKTLEDPTNDGSTLLSFIISELVDEKFPVNNDMKENAKEYAERMKESFINQYGEENYESNMNEYLSSQMNVSSIEEYETTLTHTLQQAEFLKKYVKDHYDKVFEEYYKETHPTNASIIKVSIADFDQPTTEESNKLDEVEALMKVGKSFSDISKDYSEAENIDKSGNLGIVDQNTSNIESTYGKEVADAIFGLKVGETSSKIKGTDGYYFVHINHRDKAKIKKELKNVGIDSPLLVYDDYIYYLAYLSYDVKIEDKALSDKIDTYIKETLNDKEEHSHENNN